MSLRSSMPICGQRCQRCVGSRRSALSTGPCAKRADFGRGEQRAPPERRLRRGDVGVVNHATLYPAGVEQAAGAPPDWRRGCAKCGG